MIHEELFDIHKPKNQLELLKNFVTILDMVWSNRAPILVAALLCWSVAELSTAQDLHWWLLQLLD